MPVRGSLFLPPRSRRRHPALLCLHLDHCGAVSVRRCLVHLAVTVPPVFLFSPSYCSVFSSSTPIPMAFGLSLSRGVRPLRPPRSPRDKPVRLLVAGLVVVALGLAAVAVGLAGFVASGGRLVSARSVAWGGGHRLRVSAPVVAASDEAPASAAAGTVTDSAAAEAAAAAAWGHGGRTALGKATGASDKEVGPPAFATVDPPATLHAAAGDEGELTGDVGSTGGGESPSGVPAVAATAGADSAVDAAVAGGEARTAAVAASAPMPVGAAPDLSVTEVVMGDVPPGVPPAVDAAAAPEAAVDAAIAAVADGAAAPDLLVATPAPAASAEPLPSPPPGGDPDFPPYSVQGAPPVTVLATPSDSAIPAGRGRIALLFLTTGDLTFEGLWREWLAPAGDRAVIRVHCDHASANMTSEWLNAHRTAKTVATEWGRPSLTAAMRMLLVDAATADTPERPIVKYVFLCGRSVPIQTFEYVYAALTADGDNWLSRQVPDNHLLSLPKSLQWMVLNRPSAAAVVDPRHAAAMANLVAAGKLQWNVETDEFFAAAVVGQAGLMTAAANRSAMWSVWDRGASSPRVHHDIGDPELASLRAAKAAGVLWARKFPSSLSLVPELGLHRKSEPFTMRTLYPYTTNWDVVERYGLGPDSFGGRVEDRHRMAVWTVDAGWRQGR